MDSVAHRLYRFLFARKFSYKFNRFVYNLALRGLGILNCEAGRVTGEDWFLRNYLSGKENATVFDIGANVGVYSQTVMEIEPSTRLYAFEPNPEAFSKLKEMSERYGFTAFNFGCGNKQGKRKLYDYADLNGSPHASLYREVIEEMHGSKSSDQMVEIVRLDDLVSQLNLDQVDLLKVDTEGHELDVLKGFKTFIKGGKVKAISFEFNEMNVASRTFFKDFYDFLVDYNLFRVLPRGLMPIERYRPVLCEIFAYQNIVALLRGPAATSRKND